MESDLPYGQGCRSITL